jgi:predicted nucleotidyltransferase component of viral defense system
MIQEREIKEKARKWGVPVSTIERDYAQNLLLESLSSLNIAFKGGTAIRKAYIAGYRFSDDLDFTLLSEIDSESLKRAIQAAIKTIKDKRGVNFFEDILFEENINGFEISIYFQIVQKGAGRLKIKIDITKPGKEKLLLPLNVREIIHPYSDVLASKINVYSLEEIVAEKIRSLFQRTRPRDLYDVWYLWHKVDITKVMGIFIEKCSNKNVSIDIKDFESRKDDFINAWEGSLKNQLKELPDPDYVFFYILEVVRKWLSR